MVGDDCTRNNYADRRRQLFCRRALTQVPGHTAFHRLGNDLVNGGEGEDDEVVRVGNGDHLVQLGPGHAPPAEMSYSATFTCRTMWTLPTDVSITEMPSNGDSISARPLTTMSKSLSNATVLRPGMVPDGSQSPTCASQMTVSLTSMLPRVAFEYGQTS